MAKSLQRSPRAAACRQAAFRFLLYVHRTMSLETPLALRRRSGSEVSQAPPLPPFVPSHLPDLAMPTARVPGALKECPDDDTQTAAFRACPRLDPASFRESIPDVMWAAELLSKTLAVCWEWAFLALLTTVSGLVPEDRIELTPSMSIPSSLWVLLLQPGSTNSSGVTHVVSEALRLMFARQWKDELAQHDEVVAALPENAEEPPAPPRRQLLAGGGSLAATGLQMSLAPNRSAALCVEPEVDQLLAWFTAEASIDRAAPAKLWDGATWLRPVMDKSRAFEVVNPWFGVLCGGHVPEVFRATQRDTFGLRQRVTAVFGHPLWLSISDIRAACNQLPVPSRKPEDFLAGLCFPALRWSVKRQGMVFKPSEADGACELADRQFNQHMECQREAFLEYGRQDEAKYHGKLRTKFDRLVVSLHILNALCRAWRLRGDQTDITGNWGVDFAATPAIPLQVVKSAYAFCHHAELVWKVLDFARKNHCLPRVPDPAAPTQGADPPPVEGQVAPSFTQLHRDMVESKDSLKLMEQLMNLPDLRDQVVSFLSNLPEHLSVESIQKVAQLFLQQAGQLGVFHALTRCAKPTHFYLRFPSPLNCPFACCG